MGMLNGSSMKAEDHYWMHSDRNNFFILSDVNATFLKQHEINSSVKDFKDKVRKSKPYTRVRTGSCHYNYRSTPLYRVSDFK